MSLLRHSVAVAFALTALSPLVAQNRTWNNAGTAWSDTANWSGSDFPNTNSEKAIFGTSSSPLNPNVDGTYTIQGITFSNGLTTSYTLGGSGTLIIDANSASTTNTIQVNGNQTFNVNITTTNSLGGAQRFVIGTGTGTLNFSAGKTFTVGTGGVSLQATGAGSGEFNFYGAVVLGANTLTHQSTATSVYFREGSSITSSATSGILSNSAGNMYFETDDINLGGSAQISMIGSLANDAGIFLTKDGLNVTENVRIANTSTGYTRTVGVGITGSGSATWSGNVDISQNSGSDIARTVKFTAGAEDRAIFSGNIVSTSATVFTDALQIDGGGTVVLSGNGNTYSAATSVAAGTTLLANNTTGSATGGNALTVAGTLGGTGRLAPTGTNGILVSSGGLVSPGDDGIGSLTIDLSGTTGGVTFAAGSGFSFDLNTGGAADALVFTGLTDGSGEVVFNNNTLSLISLGVVNAGTYTLFSFDQDGAYTGTLDLGTLEGFNAQLFYNADNIQLVLSSTAVPEPSTYAVIAGLGMLGFALIRRRRA